MEEQARALGGIADANYMQGSRTARAMYERGICAVQAIGASKQGTCPW